MPDFAERIRDYTREEFIEAHRYPFLVGMNAVNAPVRKRQPTGSNPTTEFDSAETSRIRIFDVGPPALQVFAVHKVEVSVSAMITVGRSANNDIVIDDVSVSKFHAFFVEGPGGLELIDAGSTNGTFLGDTRLQANKPGHLVHTGDQIKFASLGFELLDAGACFDRVRASFHP